MTMLSLKRSHAAALAPAAPAASSKTDAESAAAGAELVHSLSASLHDLLTTDEVVATASPGRSATHTPDVYSQFANSPPRTSSVNSPESQWKKLGGRWLLGAAERAGVGDAASVFGFWKVHGRDREEEFADARYLVWFVKVILMGLSAGEGGIFDDGANNDADEEGYFGDRLLEACDSWNGSVADLLQRRSGVRADDAHISKEEREMAENDDGAEAGVMWQMLLQNARLTPEKLRDALERYTTPQESHEQNAASLEGIDEDATLPAEYFAWPSFFRAATLEAAEAHSREHGGSGSNKRRRSNNSKAFRLGGSNEGKDKGWYPLLGYAVAHALLSDGGCNSMTAQQKVAYLKENVLSSLPDMLNVPTYDYATRNSISSGMIACVIDEVAEWTVLDSLALGEMTENDGVVGANGEREARMNEEVCEQMRPGVGVLVETLSVHGILPKLAELAKTTLSELVSQSADTLLNYSEVLHKLCHQNNAILRNKEDAVGETEYPQMRNAAEDAKLISSFILKANPKMELQLGRRSFDPTQFLSGEATGHPLAIYTRSLLASNDLPAASKVCKALEDCTGVDETTKKYCYFLLYERMQDLDALFEDSWNDPPQEGGGATLANALVGPLGVECALEYLEQLVLEAEEVLLSQQPAPAIHSVRQRRRYREDRESRERELLCVKDAARRTILKFLLPRAYTPHDALEIATERSYARKSPELDHTAWGIVDGKNYGLATDVVRRILERPSLYSEMAVEQEKEEEGQEEEVFEEDELLDVERREELPEAEEGRAARVTEEHPPAGEEPPPKEPVCIDESSFRDEVEKEPAEEPVAEEEEEEEEVIELGGDSEDEQEPAKEPERPPERPDEEELEEEAANQEAVDELVAAEEEEDEEVVTYPRKYHEHQGNYSESDDYSEEDEEEENRHAAFEGEYDEEEGRGESDYEVAGRQEQDESNDGLIEILDSSEEEEDEQQDEEAMEEQSSVEERDEGDVLNEKVDRYIHANESDAEEHETRADEEGEDEEMEQDKEARILSEAVKEYIIPSTGAAAAGDDDEEQKADEADAALAAQKDEAEEIDEPAEDEVATAEVEPEKRVAPEETSERKERSTREEAIDVDEAEEEEVEVDAEKHEGSDSDEVEVIDDEAPSVGSPEGDEEEDVEDIEVDYEKESNIDDDDDEDEVVAEVIEDEGAEALSAAAAKETPTKDSSMEEEDLEKWCDDAIEAAESPKKTSSTPKEPAEGEPPYSSDGGKEEEHSSDTDYEVEADDEHESIDTEDDKRSLATADTEDDAKPAGSMDTEDEVKPEEGARPSIEVASPASQDAEEITHDQPQQRQQPSVLVAAAMSSQAAMGGRFERGTIELPHAAGDSVSERSAGDSQSFDNTSAALASTDANLWENYDDASQEGEDAGVDASNVEVVARYHGHDLKLGSVVERHADAPDDTGEDSSPEVANNEEEEEGGGTDPGYMPDDADVTEEERPARPKKAIDPGYMPDAEATEEERQEPRKPVIDPGYEAEVSEVEMTEVEKEKSRQAEAAAKAAAAEKADKESANVNVRFESELETIPPAPDAVDIDDGYVPTDNDEVLTEEERQTKEAAKMPVKAAPSIDEGYEPSDTLTEEERGGETKRRRDIDKGYLADTPGEATEEDTQGEEAIAEANRRKDEDAARKNAEEISKKMAAEEEDAAKEDGLADAAEGAEETEATAAAAAEKSFSDDIDTGYLPSAVEGTEEELSEKEDLTTIRTDEAAAAEATLSPNESKLNARPSVLVATATVLTQGGQSEQAGALRMEDVDEEDEKDDEVEVAEPSGTAAAAAAAPAEERSEIKTKDDEEDAIEVVEEVAIEEEGPATKGVAEGPAASAAGLVAEGEIEEEESAAPKAEGAEGLAVAAPAPESEEVAVDAAEGDMEVEPEAAADQQEKVAADAMDADEEEEVEAVEQPIEDIVEDEEPVEAKEEGSEKPSAVAQQEAVAASDDAKDGVEEKLSKVAEDWAAADAMDDGAKDEEEAKAAERPAVETVLGEDEVEAPADDAEGGSSPAVPEPGPLEMEIRERMKADSKEKAEAVETAAEGTSVGDAEPGEAGAGEGGPEPAAEDATEGDGTQQLHGVAVTGTVQDIPDIGPGWKVNIVPRKGSDKTDSYYYSPGGERYRSLKKARAAEAMRVREAEGSADSNDEAVEEAKKEDSEEKIEAEAPVEGTKEEKEEPERKEPAMEAAVAEASVGDAKPDEDEADDGDLKPAAVPAPAKEDAAEDAAAEGDEDEEPEEQEEEIEDFSSLTVAQLKDRLRQLNLHVSGRKRELVTRLTSHLYPHLEPPEAQTDDDESVVSRSSRASRTSRAASSRAAAATLRSSRRAADETPSKPASSSVRRSARERRPTPKKAEQIADTPVSELSRPTPATAGQGSDAEDESQSQYFRRPAGESPGVPTSITTTKKRGRGRPRKQPALPAVPEGEAVEGADEELGEEGAEEAEEEEDVNKRPARSRRGRPKKDEDESSVASADVSEASRTRRGKRGATAAADDASETSAKRARRTTRAAAATKGGKDADEGSVASSSRRSARTARKKGGEDESAASTAGTRRSTRSRARK